MTTIGYKADTLFDNGKIYMPYIPLQIEKKTIKARTRKLKSVWTLEADDHFKMYSDELYKEIELALIAEQEFFTEEEFNL